MFRGARRSLVVGAAIAAIAAAGARAAVRPIGWDGCSGACGSSAISIANPAMDGAGAILTMSLLGAGWGRALVFDREAAPAVLASGFPSALSPGGDGSDRDAGVEPISDFEYVFAHPEEVSASASFVSAAPSTGLVAFGEILSDSNAYFLAQGGALRGVIQTDLGHFPWIIPPKRANFSFGDATVQRDATKPQFPWMQWDTSTSTSTDSSAPPSQ